MGEAIAVVVVLLLLLIVCVIVEIVVPYKKESSYIKMEILRSVNHREKAHWKRELKRLRKRYLPFLYMFDKDVKRRK